MNGCCYTLAYLQKFDPTTQLHDMMDNVDLEPPRIADRGKGFPTDPATIQAFFSYGQTINPKSPWMKQTVTRTEFKGRLLFQGLETLRSYVS